MVFHRSVSDSKSPQISRILLSILAILNNAVVWVVSIHPPISNSYSLLLKPLETAPSASVTIGITVTLMIHSFLSSLARSTYLLIFSFLLGGPLRRQNPLYGRFPVFFLIITRSGLLARCKLSTCISKSRRILCVSFFRTDSGLYICHLVVWSNLNFLHNSQWITFPT